MGLSVKSCTFYCAKSKIEWEITAKGDKAIVSKKIGEKKLFANNVEKKEIPKEYLSNLDIFFRIYDIENWDKFERKTEEEADSIKIVIDEKVYQLLSIQAFSDAEKNIFEDLHRYFIACFEGTAEPICLSYHSFDGGGLEYNIELEVKDIFTWHSNRHYLNPNHENLCGSGYQMEFTLYPLRTGRATAMLTGFSPICPEPNRRIFVDVDENLHMTHRIEEYEIEER